MVLGELLQTQKGEKIYTLNYEGKAYIVAETKEEALEKFRNWDVIASEEKVVSEVAIVTNRETINSIIERR